MRNDSAEILCAPFQILIKTGFSFFIDWNNMENRKQTY